MGDVKRLLSPRMGLVQQDAGFVRRALAFFVDILIMDLFVVSPFTPLLAGFVSRAQSDGISAVTYTTSEIGVIIVLFLMLWTYFLLFEYLFGQTIGMMLLGIKVEPGRLWQHVVRNAFLIPAFPFVLLWIIEPLAILIWRKSLLERMSGTRTVYERRVLF